VADATSADLSVGGARGTLSGTVASDRKSLTGLTGWTQADIGRQIISATAAFPANTTILTVGADGTTATVSDAATMTTPGAAADIAVTPSVPVPNGTYTITVVNNGAGDAEVVTGYQQSIISSGSTFTVSDY
jgi:hypothetical protein